jgi:parvulin-like peptidyl-prolyl isomerase
MHLDERHSVNMNTGPVGSEILQVGERQVFPEELLSLLSGYQMLPMLVREIVVDQAVASIECTSEEAKQACEQFCEYNQITNQAQMDAWLAAHGMTEQQMYTQAIRTLKVEKFKLATWEPHLNAYFLAQKAHLDMVVYSLIRCESLEVAQEIYFRIQANEQPFAEIARQYSEGPEAQTGGLQGPVRMDQPHPAIAKRLASSQPGQLWPPMRIESWHVIVRLERWLPAKLDTRMRQQLLAEQFETWLQEQMQNTYQVRPLSALSLPLVHHP